MCLVLDTLAARWLQQQVDEGGTMVPFLFHELSVSHSLAATRDCAGLVLDLLAVG